MIKYCPFCGHWINKQIEKCNNCGEFINVKSKRLWFLHILPVVAQIIIAVVAVVGLLRVNAILDEVRAKAIENHTTWIEVKPVDFTSKGEKDPKDQTSTFWYLKIQAQNLGKQTAFVHIKDWSFSSNKRGTITKEDYKQGEREFSLPSGDKASWITSFVMNSDYHIPPLINGEDTLTIKFSFISKDMSDREECIYDATWKYTKGEFSLLEDNRHYYEK